MTRLSGYHADTPITIKAEANVTFSERFVHFCLKSHEPMSLFSSDRHD